MSNSEDNTEDNTRSTTTRSTGTGDQAGLRAMTSADVVASILESLIPPECRSSQAWLASLATVPFIQSTLKTTNTVTFMIKVPFSIL
ncbi:hypothetical protein PGTUg99_031523 [Puccinia graminis f. sp. tritici]|uniref:Uncharacterized protein n=1 Tax=Puccinia graminis f. sp. tritici TaxID=56615 RepID=A0A5B0SKX8_PUCGR|nr:hypothetical protein PGTUg99_031523 [Puccinia graminis f. sp. tritici]